MYFYNRFMSSTHIFVFLIKSATSKNYNMAISGKKNTYVRIAHKHQPKNMNWGDEDECSSRHSPAACGGCHTFGRNLNHKSSIAFELVDKNSKCLYFNDSK